MTSSANYSTTLFCQMAPDASPRYINKIQTMSDSNPVSLRPEHVGPLSHRSEASGGALEGLHRHSRFHPHPQYLGVPKQSTAASSKPITHQRVMMQPPGPSRSPMPTFTTPVQRQITAFETSIQMSAMLRPQQTSGYCFSLGLQRPGHFGPALRQPAATGICTPVLQRPVPQRTPPIIPPLTSTKPLHLISVSWHSEASRISIPSPMKSSVHPRAILMQPVASRASAPAPLVKSVQQPQSPPTKSRTNMASSMHSAASTTNYMRRATPRTTESILASANNDSISKCKETNAPTVPSNSATAAAQLNVAKDLVSSPLPRTLPSSKPPKYRNPPAVIKSISNGSGGPNTYLAKSGTINPNQTTMLATKAFETSDTHFQQDKRPSRLHVNKERSSVNRELESRDLLTQQQPGNGKLLMRKQDWNMAACLVCLTARGGVQLFTRETNDFKALPFSVIGLLTGAHMFAKHHDATLLSTETKDFRIVWREFYDSITLIIITSNDKSSDNHLHEFLETVFHAMVMFIGLDDIINMKHVELLKRDLRHSYGLIDTLLSQLVQPNTDLLLVGDLTYAVDYLLCPESTALQTYLDSFVESAYSTYGCLLVHGRVVVGTKKWWTLNMKEMILLSLFLASSPHVTCRDVPVFLPIGSPKVPYRFLVFQLVQGVEVCVLCGQTPTLTQLEKEVGRFWKGAYELLKSTLQYHYRSFPSSITMDRNIIGLIVINREDRKCLCSVYPHGSLEDGYKDDSGMSAQQRLTTLRSFYKMVAGTVFMENIIGDANSKGGSFKVDNDLMHECCETYVNSLTYKLYAAQTSTHQILIMFSSVVPTFALRSVTHKTLQVLTRGKFVKL